MAGLFRQSVFGRLGGYEDVNDADRLGRDPAMRWIDGGHARGRSIARKAQSARRGSRRWGEGQRTGEVRLEDGQ